MGKGHIELIEDKEKRALQKSKNYDSWRYDAAF